MEKQLTTTQGQKMKFSTAIKSEVYSNLIKQTLGDEERAKRFVSAISSAVAVNETLQECTPASILAAALLGESLNLSPSPQLGQYYLVPYKDTKKGITTAQFQLGYKGYIQLAIRSGQYKKLNVIAIKEGELIKYDPLNEDIEVNLIEDEERRELAPTIGYYAMFEYINGFKKTMYWSKTKMQKHALRYSKGYAARKGYTFWEKDFDSMAFKTMLRQLLSKWGVLSIEMQEAFTKDMATINTDGTYDYVDNENEDSDENSSPEIIEQDEVETAEIVSVEPEEEQVNLNEL